MNGRERQNERQSRMVRTLLVEMGGYAPHNLTRSDLYSTGLVIWKFGVAPLELTKIQNGHHATSLKICGS